MPLFGELFLSELLKKPVLDPRGEEMGRLRDISVIKGEPLPKVESILIERKKGVFAIAWQSVNIFNKRIMSATVYADSLSRYSFAGEDLLAVRDILDKQIVDANGVKVVRVNDIKLEGYESDAVLVAVDVGLRGILRRLGMKRGADKLLGLFRARLPHNLISWNYIQPLNPKLSEIALTVPRQMMSDIHPADLAELISQVSPDEGAQFIENLDVETAAEAITELEPDARTAMLRDMDAEKAAGLLGEMAPDSAADILSGLPAEKAKEILEHVEKEDAEDIQELLSHEADTAGGLMTTEYVACPASLPVAEVIEMFKKDAPEKEAVYYVYALNDEGKLAGVASLRDLLLSGAEAKFSDIMETKFKSLPPDADRMQAAAMISKYNLVALPVVDAEGYVLGVVTIDDIMDRILPPQARRKRRGI